MSGLRSKKNFSSHSEKEKVSALIPFCYLGDEFSPTEEGNFQDSVCKLFREKIVSGQVCYEVDVSHHRERSANWGDVLQRGFSFIIDTNDEYDVKNLLEKKPSGRRGDVRYHSDSLYERKEKDDSLSIFLKTISKILRVIEVDMKITIPQTPCLSYWLERATTH